MTDITDEQRKLAVTVKQNVDTFISWWNAADAAGLTVNFQIGPSAQVGQFRELKSFSVTTKPLDVLAHHVAQDDAPDDDGA